MNKYEDQLNLFSAVEEYLLMFIDNLTIVSINTVILQGSTLSQLTSTTNQLTRNALVSCLILSIVYSLIRFM